MIFIKFIEIFVVLVFLLNVYNGGFWIILKSYDVVYLVLDFMVLEVWFMLRVW